jgi:hypothetical protein
LGFHKWKAVREEKYITTSSIFEKCEMCPAERERLFWYGVEQ